MTTPATTERTLELRSNYLNILKQVQQAAKESNRATDPRLVAVSKLKPASDILSLYESTQVLHFGENYPQELHEKASTLPSDIQWHYIGTLQSNKCKILASIPNLFAVETLTSSKAATQLERGVPTDRTTPLNVYIQINTSGEVSKSGLPTLSVPDPSHEVSTLAQHILGNCPHLRLKGLMTIGSVASSSAGGTNPDFEALTKTRDNLLAALRELRSNTQLKDNIDVVIGEGLELSCGMSEDFAQAIKQGSDNVRVGSSIFGSRPPKN